MSPWTPEKVTQLKALMDEGLSFAQIGAAIGMGRNSCIGKAHRLGLRRGEEAEHPPGPRKPRPSRARPYRHKNVPSELRPARVPPPRPGPVLIHELEPHHCRFIVRDGGAETTAYCGEPVLVSTSWCAVHHRVCYARGSQ